MNFQSPGFVHGMWKQERGVQHCRTGGCPHTFILSADGEEGELSTFVKVTVTVGIVPVAASPITKDYPAVCGTRF